MDKYKLTMKKARLVEVLKSHCCGWSIVHVVKYNDNQSSDLDIAVPAGIGDDEYMALLSQTLPEAIRQADPDIVFYDAGVDTHKDGKWI